MSKTETDPLQSEPSLNAEAEAESQAEKGERPFLSREEVASIFYGSVFAIVAIGCFVLVGWW